MVLRPYDNEEGSVQGLILFFLMIIFAAATYFWLTLPMTDGIATAVTLYWTISGLTPDAAYQAGFQNIAALNSSSTIAMLTMVISGMSFLIVALRAKFGVN
jgi:hypothetical protein